MRIITGSHAKRTILVPNNLPVRPTTDLSKEALFNILKNHVDLTGKHALDLFSGTGNIAYELASRGCTQVIAVDKHAPCLCFIKSCAKKHNLQAIETHKKDVFEFLNRHKKSDCYDFIFADPPYEMPDIFTIAKKVSDKKLLKPGGFLVIEHAKHVLATAHQDHAQAMFTESRLYGQTTFSFFRRPAV